ncbi:SusC/RagA family TonB-linked outer membrane protein [Niastella caeni]|uniref:SusC/RagA family TonB-linked outer membrane protein n=1 Tax=Niastella caeni TaxID=2569763 RepID=A0A4S8I1J9_9BACT|nr:SusC/RagA family TonB-linked outer membrane protein [Niastella caeni]THU41079.1 SusC/RagA family TonB-linked outer membrane protein [Niastella caeni]
MRKTKNLTKRRAGIRAMAFATSLLLALLLQVQLMAQQKTVAGKVVNAASGEPIAGASIVVKGTNMGGTTDEKGIFSLSVPVGVTTLMVSYTGFLEMEIPASENIRTIKLTALGDMGEVVVVGYGKQKKTTLTGAVEIVSGKTFESRAVTNVALALQGVTPGLVVTRSSPRPGNEGLNLVIRGLSSVNGSAPLIIIDGVPALNSFSFLNMNADDIESISVLKDASATIYGSAAANGVILVTTKRGKGKTKYDFTSNFRFNTNGITGYSPSMQQYATMWIEANKEETNPNWWVWGSKDNMLKMQEGYEGVWRFSTWPGVDYFIYNANRIKEMFATRYSHQNNVSVSGGNEKSSYRISLGFADNKGNLATAYDGQKQYNARFNYDIKLSEKLKLETAISLVDAKTSTPSAGLDNTLYGYDMPFFPAKNPSGQWFATFNGVDGGANRNAAARTSDGGRDNQNSLTGRIDVKAIFQVYKDLSIEGLASLQNERFNQERYLLAVPVYNWYGRQTGWAGALDTTKTSYFTRAWTSAIQYYQLVMRYNKTFKGLHNFSAVAGIDAQKFNYNWVSANRIGFTDLGVQNISLASTATQTNDGFSSQTGNYAYLARLNYGYDDKYLVELQGRIDGSSRFAAGHKFQKYGGISAGWVFTNEDFLSNITSILNYGKLRASYGSSGNQAAGLGEFDYLSLVRMGTTVLGSPAALQNSSSLLNNGLISYSRTWERVEQKNVALELGFFNNRLSSTVEYFTKDNIGMLINVNYPSVLGGSAPPTNSGHFNTKGWEVILKWNETKKDWSYNIAINMSNTKTRVTGVQGADGYGAGRNGIVNGLPFQPWFVYKTDGYFADQKEVDAYYAAYGSSGDLAAYPQNNLAVALRPGDTKKVDVAGSGSITGTGNQKSSLVYAGDGTPHYTFGINLGGSWKGFDLNAFFQGQLKQLMMRNGYMAYPFNALFTNQNPKFLGQTWTAENTDAIFPRLTVNPNRARWNYANNDFMLQNNRYVRLKTLIVGYSLPQSLIKKAKLEKVRFYFSGNDLWELAHIKDGFDPEMGETSQNAGYPFARTWSFGVNVGF